MRVVSRFKSRELKHASADTDDRKFTYPCCMHSIRKQKSGVGSVTLYLSSSSPDYKQLA